MSLSEFLAYLQASDIKLWLDGDRLRYAAPSGVFTPTLGAELARRKEEIIRALREVDNHSTSLLIRPVTEREKSPLSHTQESMWFMQQLSPGTSAYNCYRALRLTGALNRAALEETLNEIVRRHGSLRTTFPALEGLPFQVVTPPTRFKLPILDIAATITASRREAEAERIIIDEIERPFDLFLGPVFRTRLIHLNENDHVLVLTMHHIVTDGWSMEVLLRELVTIYEALSRGAPSPLPPLEVQYTDFAYWQRGWLNDEQLVKELPYWKGKLEGFAPFLQLPTDHPRPAVQSSEGASLSVEISRNVTGGLKAFSQRENATLYMTLLAAFQTLLYRYTAQADMVIGSPFAGRLSPQINGLIGLFMNTLLLRADLSGNPSFRDLVRRVRETTLEAFDHQIVPFEKLSQTLKLERSLSHSPFFQVMFALQSYTELPLKVPGLNINSFKIKRHTAISDLALSVAEVGREIKGTFSYKTELFEQATVERMLRHFQILLHVIVADPDRRIADLPMLTDVERRRVLVEWNDTKRGYPQDRLVHEMFEEQVERTPETTAVAHDEERLSYQELDRRANRLARYLKKRGVGPEALVGICMERSVEMVVAQLGILKAGGAYVPLDPNYPMERIASVLSDSQASLVLTQQRLVSKLPKMIADGRPLTGDDARSSIPQQPTVIAPQSSVPQSAIRHPAVICLDSEWEIISRESAKKLIAQATPDNLAYVIYTSGSTGVPKGVEIAHRSLSNFVSSTGAAFALGPGDRVLQFASLSFDTAAEEIFPCLIRGATLVLRTDSMLESVSMFFERCRDWEITILDLPTAYWHEVAEKLSSEQLTLPERLRLVIVGGEKALPERLLQWQQAVGDSVRLLNTYGPTEATVVATVCELAGSAIRPLREVPIGRPISNVQTYLLDRHLNPVPIGVSGELHIGGIGLARGYLNRADLTAERFIPSPFSENPGDRLYKTGDLARYLPDGNIEFVGRLDNQVKIRGFRIELGEIEAALTQHPAIQQSVAVVREDTPGHNRLVAYVVPNKGQAATGNDLRSFLKLKLPEYMLPSAFVVLDAFPLTSNRKVDRRALPAPDQSGAGERGYVAPRTEVEKRLAVIWAEVLRLEQVGIHEDFFNLGGHSLLATQVMSRVRNAFQLEIALRTLFENPTVAELALQIVQLQAQSNAAEDMAQVLADVESLSDEQTNRLLAQDSSHST